MNEISVVTCYCFTYTSNNIQFSYITLFIYIAHNVQNLPLQVHLVSSCDILDELSGIAGCGPSLLICKNQSELCTLKLI